MCSFLTEEQSALLIDVLTKQNNLLTLVFDAEIGSSGSAALANMLIYPESNIHSLELRYHNWEMKALLSWELHWPPTKH